MDGIYTAAGGRFKTKKSLREAIGSQVSIEPTSAFGNAPTRYPYDAPVVGPHPYDRRWYARVSIDASGILRKVDGKGGGKKSSPRSWRPEVFVEGKWSCNALRFPTQAEAEGSAHALLCRWFVPTDSRAAPSDDPPTYRHVDGRDTPIPAPSPVTSMIDDDTDPDGDFLR